MKKRLTIRQAIPLVVSRKFKKELAKLIYEDLKIISGLGKKKRELTLQEQIKKLIRACADQLELKTAKQLQSIVFDVNTINKKLSETIGAKDFEIVDKLKSDLDELNKSIVENQKVIDGFIESKPVLVSDKDRFKIETDFRPEKND